MNELQSISTFILCREHCELSLTVSDDEGSYTAHVDWHHISYDDKDVSTMVVCCMENWYNTQDSCDTDYYGGLMLPVPAGTLEEDHRDDCIWPKYRRYIDIDNDVPSIKAGICSAIDMTCREMETTKASIWQHVEFPLVLCFSDIKFSVHVQIDKDAEQPESGISLSVMGYIVTSLHSSSTPYLMVESRNLVIT